MLAAVRVVVWSCVKKEDEERCAVVIADGEVVGAAKKAPDTDESSGTEEDE